MNPNLELYIPPHPNAPNFVRRQKGVSIDKYTKKPVNKIKDLQSLHEKFNRENPESKKTSKELGLIFKTFNKNLCVAASENRAGAMLPNRIAKVQVLMCNKGREQSVDQNTSLKLGYTVCFSSLKNAGKFPLVQLDLEAKGCNLPNKEFWEFKAGAAVKKNIQNILLIDRTRFFDIKEKYAPKNRKSKFYKKEFAMKYDAEILKKYNEFDFS